MPRSDKTNAADAAGDSMTAARALLSLNPVLAPQAKHFWQVQERFLQEAEKFSSAWFKRRHDATRSALEVASQIANDGMQDPAAAMKTMTEWRTQSVDRLAEDAKDCTEMMTRCIGSLVVNEIEAAEETAENTKNAASAKHATPV